MYATDLRDQLFAAALPLKPLVVWCGSACSVTVAVPPAPAIEGLAISSVSIELSLPSGEVVSASATQKTGTPLWTATFAASNFATAGLTTQGFTVYLGGKDETGADRVWIVAKGDLEVRAGDAAPSPGGSYYIVKLRDSAPANPVAGDAYLSGGKLHIYSGTAWTTIGGADPSDDAPLMDGEASAGESDAYARGDHRHPSDNSKLDGAAAYPAWDRGIAYDYPDIVSYDGKLWRAAYAPNGYPGQYDGEWELVTLNSLKQDALTSAQMDAVNSGATAAKVATWDGYAAQIAQKANATDLPYAMVTVTTGEWVTSNPDYAVVEAGAPTAGAWWSLIAIEGESPVGSASGNADFTSLTFIFGPDDTTVTATRSFTLLDRANNLIDATTGNVTLTLPPFAAGKVRDLLVACTVGVDGNDEPWSVIFQGADGEEISFKAEGDDAASATFPVPTAAGDWWYSFTERAPHVFAVSLKQLQSVSQPTQTQGGS